MSRLVWSVHDAPTGDLLDDDVRFRLTTSLTRWISKGDAFDVMLPAEVSELPSRWRSWTLQNDTLVACRDEAAGAGDYAIAAGLLRRTNYGSRPEIAWTALPIDTVLSTSLLGYPFDWRIGTSPRYLPLSYKGTFPEIAASMGLAALADHFGSGRCVIRDYPGTHKRSWAIDDKKVALEALRDLSAVEGGPEWVIRWRFTDAMGIQCVPEIAARVGRGMPLDGTQPPLIEDVEWEMQYDCTAGAFANAVAVSGDRISATVTSIKRGSARALYTHDVTSYDVQDQDALNRYAAGRFAVLSDGRRTLTAKFPLKEIQLGVELDVGDLVRIDCAHPISELAMAPLCRIIGLTLEDGDRGVIEHVTPTLEVVSWS